MEQQEEFMALKYESVEMCAQCGGRFPGPGVGWRGQIYCCDNCAEQSEQANVGSRLMRLLPVAAVVVGAGALIYRYGATGNGDMAKLRTILGEVRLASRNIGELLGRMTARGAPVRGFIGSRAAAHVAR
ncbi:MAG: hypothetical protein V2A77_04040 [Pseudomonadota bacterium]